MSHPLALLARRGVETAFAPIRLLDQLLSTPTEPEEELGAEVDTPWFTPDVWVTEDFEDPTPLDRDREDAEERTVLPPLEQWLAERAERAEHLPEAARTGAQEAALIRAMADTADERTGLVDELGEALDDRLGVLGDVVEEGVDLVEDSLGTHRRVWTDEDADDDEVERAHIEVRGVEQPEATALRRRLVHALQRLEQVHWVEVNALTSRVAIAFDEASPVSALVQVIEAVEDHHGLREERLDEQHRKPVWDAESRAEHPADVEPIHRTIATIAGNVVGLGYAAVGRAARLPRLPTELASVASLVDHNPWLRRRIEQVLGRRATELVLPLGAAAGSGASQGPVGILVDLGHHGLRLSELRARQRVWQQREPEFYADADSGTIEPPDVSPRPVPLPQGPVERWSQRISLASLGGFGVGLATTGDPRLSADAFLAGMPKAARLGREAFAAQLGRTLAARGAVPLDASALRRLDRVDTVVIDSDALVTGTRVIDDVVTFNGADAEDVRHVSQALLDPHDLTASRRQGAWSLRPLADVAELPPGGAFHAAELRGEGAVPLVVLREQTVVGMVGVEAELDPAAEHVVQAVREAGLRLLVAGRKGDAERLIRADGRLPRGVRLGEAIRHLQALGATVMLISRRGKNGQAAADVGVGLTRASGRPPWGADLVLGRELVDAVTVIRAVPAAHAVSQRSAWFAAGGSGLGALMALSGPRQQGGSRTLFAVNGAAGAALIAGTWAALEVANQRVPRVRRHAPWHAMSVEETLARLGSSPEGMAERPAVQRHRTLRGGEREMGAAEPFLAELANPLNPVLGVGAALSAAVGSMVDASMVLGLIGINAAVGGVQRLRADRAVAALMDRSAQPVRVVRGGEEQVLLEDRLVPGDVIVLSAGEPVPADCRVLEADGLEVDESSLTGESLPVAKQVAATPDAPLPDRASMLYEDTVIAAGSARAVVVAVGEDTELSRALEDTDRAPESGVDRRLAELTRRIVPLAGAAGAGVTIAGLLRRWPIRDVAGTAVSLAVAAVPEGMPFLASAAQIAGARRLADRRAVARNPRTIEALGRVDTLCVDKTGTLTEGRMRLRAVSDGTEVHAATGAAGTELPAHARRVLVAVCRAVPELDADDVAHDQTERALLEGAQALGISAADAGGWREREDLPFEPSRSFSAALGSVRGGHRVAVKGAPEAVLARCARWRRNGSTVAMTPERRSALVAHAEELAARGWRVLAVAERAAEPGNGDLDPDSLDGLTLHGFTALADPVRPAAAEAIAGVRRGHVRPVLVTGDHPGTAAAVAEELGMVDGRVVSGSELDALDDAALDAIVQDVAVFARVAPAQKVRIVASLQRHGRVVAMTGDGANDAPAIRLADVGVALSRRATAAAREASDLVVTDDRVETLIDAIVEGRALWGSVREALAVLVGGNLGEIGFTVLSSLASTGAPMNARQFLLVNLLTDLAPAIAIAIRPPKDASTEALLREGPEASLGAQLTRDITVRATTTALGASAAWFAARATGRAQRASTVALVALVGTQLGQTVAAGGIRRPLVVVTGVGSAAVLAGIVQTPGVSQFMGCTPLGPLGWSQAATASVVATAGSQAASWWLARARPLERGHGAAAGARDAASV